MADATLSMEEANALLSAWAQHQADSHGLRLLILKGQALSHYGLRPPRVSSDVDVLVDPAHFAVYLDIVVESGWVEFPSSYSSDMFTLHSRTFRKDGWPNSLDIHNSYPGFIREPGVVFDALWCGRMSLEIAHRACQVPSRVASVFILTLHSLRSSAAQLRHVTELEHLRLLELSAQERREAYDLAVITGAALALRDFLGDLAVKAPVDAGDLTSSAYIQWRTKVAGANSTIELWLSLLSASPWRARPSIVRSAVWPSAHDYLVDHPGTQDRTWDLFLARLARLGGAARQLWRRLWRVR